MHIPPNWGTFFALIVSFLAFWFIFGRLFFRPFLNLLSERERRFKDLSARTEDLVRRAKAADDEREARLATLRQQALSKREGERRRAESEASKLLEDAKSDARAALESASTRISNEISAAERELENMGGRLAAE